MLSSLALQEKRHIKIHFIIAYTAGHVKRIRKRTRNGKAAKKPRGGDPGASILYYYAVNRQESSSYPLPAKVKYRSCFPAGCLSSCAAIS